MKLPWVTLVLVAAGLAALPLSLHFEGNDGSAEPFIFVFPLLTLLALVGVVFAFRARESILVALNSLGGLVALLGWIALVTYQGD